MTKLTHNAEVSDEVRALNPHLFETPNPAGLTPAQKAWRTQNQADPASGTVTRTHSQQKAYILRAHLRHLQRRAERLTPTWTEVTGSPILATQVMDLLSCMLERIEEECDE